MRRSLIAGLLALSSTIFAQTGNPPTPTDGPYSISTTWLELPASAELGRPVSATVSGDGAILVLRQRVDPPIAVFDAQCKYLRGWGEGLFKGAHSIGVDRDGFVWTTDNQDNTGYKFSMNGQLLMTLGKRGTAGDNTSQDAFDGPSNVTVAPNGDIFVTGGYRNSRVVKFRKMASL